MACGDKYRYLLRTGVGGYTADDPYPLITTEFQYQDWYEAIAKFRPMLNKRWADLRRIELDQNAGSAASDAVVPGIKEFNSSFDDMMSPFDMFDLRYGTVSPARKIDNAIAVGELATCMLERIDDAADELGVPLPEVPGVKEPKHKQEDWLKDIGDSIKTVGMLALVGGGLYLAGRYVWRNRGQFTEGSDDS